jgi:hypothetical protein
MDVGRRTSDPGAESETRADAPSGCSALPVVGAASFTCGPDVGAGAGGGAWRSGEREQLGPEHGTFCGAGEWSAAAAPSELAVGPFKMVT